MKSSFPDLVIPETSLPEFIKTKIKQFGEDTALINNTNGRSVTFRELYDQINKLSFAFARVGLKKGDVVGICSTNCIEYPIAFLAILSCGATAVTCCASFKKDNFLDQFGNTEPRFLIVGNELQQEIKEVVEKLPSVQEVFTIFKSPGSRSIEEFIKNEEIKENFTQVEIDTKEDTAMIFYSSGTTGTPKGVMHTHRSLICFIEIWRYHSKQFRSNCCMTARPMHGVYGLFGSFLGFVDGVKFIFDKKFDFEIFLQAIEKYKVSHLFVGLVGITAMAKREVNQKYDTLSLQQIICSGETVSSDLMDRVEKRFGCIVSSTYGLTEIDPLSFSHPVTYSTDSVGMITANTELKICNVLTGSEVGIGQLGDIFAKGPQMMKGYYKNPEATAKTIDNDGWLNTGDVGYLNKDGMLYITGRKKEMIKNKGNLVAPAELEKVLLQHPHILDAAVIGVPSEQGNQVPRAYITAKDQSLNEKKVMEFIEEKMPNEKHLRGGVQFIDEIPVSSSGKIAREKLLKIFQESLKKT